MIDLEAALREHQDMVAAMGALLPAIERAAVRLSALVQGGGRLLWLGNGGSAADSQHMAAELVGRFACERNPIPALALTTDTSILTAVGNDYGFEQIFVRQLKALARRGDALLALSTSGNSQNVLAAVETASAMGLYTVGLTGGGGGRLRGMVDEALVVPSAVTARIQEGHLIIGHLLCEWIERDVLAAGGVCKDA